MTTIAKHILTLNPQMGRSTENIRMPSCLARVCLFLDRGDTEPATMRAQRVYVHGSCISSRCTVSARSGDRMGFRDEVGSMVSLRVFAGSRTTVKVDLGVGLGLSKN